MAPFSLDAGPPEDGLADREAGSWALVKLRILKCYINGFVNATKQARHRYYVEGFSGPGVNRIRGSDERVWGSPFIAIGAEPEFDMALFLDRDETAVEALRGRTEVVRNRVLVQRGDCNADLVPWMGSRLDRSSPTLCVLDPEGADLAWTTVKSIAAFKSAGRKVEQLILLPTDTGFIRTLFLHRELEPWAISLVDRIYGNDRWRGIYERRRRDELTPDDARTAYVQLYGEGLRELGYETVLDRAVQKDAGGSTLYFLVFATDDSAGTRIMDHCFDSVWAEEQPTLPGIKGPRRRRIT